MESVEEILLYPKVWLELPSTSALVHHKAWDSARRYAVPRTEWETNSPCEIPSFSDAMMSIRLQQCLQQEIGVVEGTMSTFDGNLSCRLPGLSSMKIPLAKVLPNRRVSSVTIH